MSSDGGLCGGIHSSISRYIKKEFAGAKDSELIILGDKPKAQLSRQLSQNLRMTFSGVGKDVPTFAEACAVADEVGKIEGGWDEVSAAKREARSAQCELRRESSPLLAPKNASLPTFPRFIALSSRYNAEGCFEISWSRPLTRPADPNHLEPLHLRHFIRNPTHNDHLFQSTPGFTGIPIVRSGRQCRSGFGRVCTGQCNLHCARRGACGRDLSEEDGDGECIQRGSRWRS